LIHGSFTQFDKFFFTKSASDRNVFDSKWLYKHQIRHTHKNYTATTLCWNSSILLLATNLMLQKCDKLLLGWINLFWLKKIPYINSTPWLRASVPERTYITWLHKYLKTQLVGLSLMFKLFTGINAPIGFGSYSYESRTDKQSPAFPPGAQ
jgi:hypothetical protein